MGGWVGGVGGGWVGGAGAGAAVVAAVVVIDDDGGTCSTQQLARRSPGRDGRPALDQIEQLQNFRTRDG